MQFSKTIKSRMEGRGYFQVEESGTASWEKGDVIRASRDGWDINGVDEEYSSGCTTAHGRAGRKPRKPEDGKESHLG